MRTITLLIVAVIYSTTLFAQQTQIKTKDPYGNGGKITYSYYLEDGKEILHGSFKYYYEDSGTDGGAPYSRTETVTGQYVKGLANGTWNWKIHEVDYGGSPYYETSTRTMTRQYLNGDAHGTWSVSYSGKYRKRNYSFAGWSWGPYENLKQPYSSTVQFNHNKLTGTIAGYGHTYRFVDGNIVKADDDLYKDNVIVSSLIADEDIAKMKQLLAEKKPTFYKPNGWFTFGYVDFGDKITNSWFFSSEYESFGSLGGLTFMNAPDAERNAGFLNEKIFANDVIRHAPLRPYDKVDWKRVEEMKNNSSSQSFYSDIIGDKTFAPEDRQKLDSIYNAMKGEENEKREKQRLWSAMGYIGQRTDITQSVITESIRKFTLPKDVSNAVRDAYNKFCPQFDGAINKHIEDALCSTLSSLRASITEKSSLEDYRVVKAKMDSIYSHRHDAIIELNNSGKLDSVYARIPTLNLSLIRSKYQPYGPTLLGEALIEFYKSTSIASAAEYLAYYKELCKILNKYIDTAHKKEVRKLKTVDELLKYLQE